MWGLGGWLEVWWAPPHLRRAVRPAWYKKLKQQTCIGVFRLPSGNNNESWHKTDCCNVQSYFFIRSTQRHLVAISGGGRRLHRSVNLVSDSWWKRLLLSFPTCFFVFFYQKKIKLYIFFFIILNSIYFQAIQIAVFYQKNTYKNFRPNFLMFLDHGVSCDQNKS